jgi:uncharacterized protein (TIGR00369 family)
MSVFPFSTAITKARVNRIKQAWDTMKGVPGGKLAFSLLIGRLARCSGTIDARVEELRRGHCEVSMKDTPKVRNHLESVHAIALINLAEIAANVALSYGLPDDARFIVSSIKMDYLRKARGTIRAICDCPVPLTSARREFEIIVSLQDESKKEVAQARITSLVGPQKG